MAHAFTLWFGRLFFSARPMVKAPLGGGGAMRIEVERLPDYRWGDLGFLQPRRLEEGE